MNTEITANGELCYVSHLLCMQFEINVDDTDVSEPMATDVIDYFIYCFIFKH